MQRFCHLVVKIMLRNKQTNLLVVALFFLYLNFKPVISQKLCNGTYNSDIRIDGKVVIVTGGTSGLGSETARNLASRGGRIYLAARGEKRGNEAVEAIRKSTGNANVQFIHLDLGSLKSIRQFSTNFHTVERKLDILINNAGLASDYSKTEDGFEMTMGVNHLGHFLLTNLLLDLLKASAPSRIIVVSSIVHRIGSISRNNFNSEIFFPGVLKSYSNSKLANVLFALELSKRLHGTGVTVNSMDPGFTVSSLGQNLPDNLRIIFAALQQLFAHSVEHGSQTHVMLAVDPSVNYITGKYFVDCVQENPSLAARNVIMAQWLWNESARLTKLNIE